MVAVKQMNTTKIDLYREVLLEFHNVSAVVVRRLVFDNYQECPVSLSIHFCRLTSIDSLERIIVKDNFHPRFPLTHLVLTLVEIAILR